MRTDGRSERQYEAIACRKFSNSPDKSTNKKKKNSVWGSLLMVYIIPTTDGGLCQLCTQDIYIMYILVYMDNYVTCIFELKS